MGVEKNTETTQGFRDLSSRGSGQVLRRGIAVMK